MQKLYCHHCLKEYTIAQDRLNLMKTDTNLQFANGRWEFHNGCFFKAERKNKEKNR